MNFKFLAANRAFFSFTTPTVLVITSCGAKFLRTADCCRKFVSANLTFTSFKLTFFLAFFGTITVLAAIYCLKFRAADNADKFCFFRRTADNFPCKMNSFVLFLRYEFKIRKIVVIVIEVAVMNVVAFGNFAVKVRPNETV